MLLCWTSRRGGYPITDIRIDVSEEGECTVTHSPFSVEVDVKIDSFPMIETERTVLTILAPDQAGLLLDYVIGNQDHLAPWESEREGYARVHLNIDGRWQDHVLNSLINPHHPGGRTG